MIDISLETVAGKLNQLGFEAFRQASLRAKKAGHRNIELAHLLAGILANDRSDMSITLDHFKLDRARVSADIQRTIEGFRANVTEMPGFTPSLTDALDRGWVYATLLFGEVQIRTGHILIACLQDKKLQDEIFGLSRAFRELNPETVASEARLVWEESDEEHLRPMDGSGLTSASSAAAEGEGKGRGSSALDRFSIDMTAIAASGQMDPVVGRDDEIRQIIDVLMRRRQNNPILTGEAGVGKTAVVEGFAQRLASGDVPPQLKGVKLHALDIGLMQAGASMKGEFEQRLRSVIDEVQASPTPIILFIDEAHTLIGAGGAQGTGDAANLLKPALARGTLRTIGATTFAEYRQYFEKDPALTRRFQPVNVDEPSLATCTFMLRGLLAPMEKHHGVRISDAAVAAAVTLSARYIPARQLPDKAVSLLDTACARVAISQTTTPARIADLTVAIAALEKERDALRREADLGTERPARLKELEGEIADRKNELAGQEEALQREKAIVDDILALRKTLAESAGRTEPSPDAAPTVGADEASDQSPAIAETAAQETAPTNEQGNEEAVRSDLSARIASLSAINTDDRMIYAHVDEDAVASVVSDWTGIPVGRMVKDELETILQLSDILNKRVLGQTHGLDMIARRIETNRAKLDNPNKPIGVFMLCGPSGVGKTETALALAEALYGGEQNVITINMSEFQEAHSVSLLKGAPPGYVGYGEGGRLTEAVRRKPYSVVLLDEVEKAHQDVHEIFFQVFDKGQMEDGNGRQINFKNTLIILTSNVGTEVIMQMAEDGKTKPDPETLNTALRPYLLEVFPPALIGRVVTIPYFPLSGDMLGGIVRLQLDRIVQRVRENHEATLTYTGAVVEHIVAQCNDPDSGGRMIDNIITNTLLPELSREFLTRIIEKKEIGSAEIDVATDTFTYRCKP